MGERTMEDTVSSIGDARGAAMVEVNEGEVGPSRTRVPSWGTPRIPGPNIKVVRVDQLQAAKPLASYAEFSFDGELSVSIDLPVKLESEANRSSVWSKGAAFASIKKHKEQKSTTRLLLIGAFNNLPAAPKAIVERWRTTRGEWLCIATIVRKGKRKLDSDNLARSAKRVRDSIAETLGVDDGDECEADSKWEWNYMQAISPAYGTRLYLEWRKLWEMKTEER